LETAYLQKKLVRKEVLNLASARKNHVEERL